MTSTGSVDSRQTLPLFDASRAGAAALRDDEGDRDRPAARVILLAAYVLLILAPLAFMLAAGNGPRRSWVVDFSVAIGFVGLMMLALQTVLPSRASSFTAPFGVDLLLGLHRQLGLLALGLVLMHVAILVGNDPELSYLLNPLEAPWRARFGGLAVVSLVALVGTSLWRRRVRLSYEGWRAVHIALGIGVLGFSLLHIVGVGRYVSFESLRWIALIATLLGLLAVFYLRVARPRLAARDPYEVAAVRPERGGATTIELASSARRPARFRPGQFAWLKLAGAPYALIEHPFSYSSSAERPERPQFTVKARGDFTEAVAELEPGTPVLIDGPHGSFRLRGEAPIVLLAAGVGITPTMSILRTLADRRDRRPLCLIYASRRWDDVTFREELFGLQECLDLEVIHVLSEPHIDWCGVAGRLDRRKLAICLPEWCDAAEFFVCGPQAFADAVTTHLRILDISPGRVHAESFGSV